MKNNRVIRTIFRLLEAPDVPSGIGQALEEICHSYGFDRARDYVRLSAEGNFTMLHQVCGDKPYTLYDNQHEIDMGRSFYKRNVEMGKSILDYMNSNPFTNIVDFDSYVDELVNIGFEPSEEKVIQALLVPVAGNDADTGIMGYFILERYEGNTLLTEDELFEIKSLFKVCNEKIENFERGKQLREDDENKKFDDLTGLSKLKHFKTNVEQAIKGENNYAMIYLDVDKFKYINENWSFDTGSEIIQSLAEVIKEFAFDGEYTCRIDSDKFAILIRYCTEEELAYRLEILNDAFNSMQQEKYSDIKITIICGIYMIKDKMSFNSILDRANIARRTIKGSYKNGFVVYNENLENFTEREKELEKRVISALEEGEFVPFLQPKFNLTTNEIVGAEALARWMAKDRMISPWEFIPVFEKNGFITKLDFVIYEQVFKFLKKCISEDKLVPRISLNVSRDHIENPDFLDELLVMMKKYEVSVDVIELEITEGVFAKDTKALKKFIEDIRQEGLAVSIDDFGTAYSSLNLLKDIVVDVVKMDKSFIDNLGEGFKIDDVSKDRVIIKNILQMIKELDFDSIFEGIETPEHIEFLKGIGCKYGQGYVFARPMPLEEFDVTYLK